MKKFTILVILLIIISPFWGSAYADSKHIFLAMIDNHKDARPQYGIGEADIVYEMPVEGGITRFMAIFIEKKLKKIGPIRSAREYFVKLAYPYKGLYVHCGGSPYAYIAIKKLGIYDLDELKYRGYFKRDNNKKSPHNLFTSTILLNKAIKKFHIPKTKRIPYFGAKITNIESPQTNLGLIKKIFIKYNKRYAITYLYEKSKKIYIRYINDKPWKDALTDEPIMANNVIILFMSSKLRTKDTEGRLMINVEGVGKGIVFTGGKFLPVRWVKHPKEPIFLMDKTGGRISLSPGKTWIQIISKDKGEVAYK